MRRHSHEAVLTAAPAKVVGDSLSQQWPRKEGPKLA